MGKRRRKNRHKTTSLPLGGGGSDVCNAINSQMLLPSDYSPGTMAPEGQTEAQVPQSMQVSGSIL